MRRSVALLCAVWLASPAAAHLLHGRPDAAPVLSVVAADGRTLPVYPRPGGTHDEPGWQRAYLAAEPGLRYRLRVHNPGPGRVGVVLAVDGRNIISGRRSALARDEPMYVLGPYETRTFDGWRGSLQQVNAFYFTHAADSYAAAWSDLSALGLIAMAAFAEAGGAHVRPRGDELAPGARRHEDLRGDSAARSEAAPGTGYGAPLWSPAYRVEFEAAAQPLVHRVLKYEWAQDLCRRGIGACAPDSRTDRWWPGDGFAPPPRRW